MAPRRKYSIAVEVHTYNKAGFYTISITGESPYTVVTNVEGEEVKVHLYERTRGDDFPNAPTSSSAHTDCFAGCQGLSDYANIPEDWK